MNDRDHDPQMPSVNQPLNAPPRSSVGPAIITLILLGVIALIFLAIFLLR